MSWNRYKPHVLLFLEDDSYREIMNGFIHNPAVNQYAIDFSRKPFGGWLKVADELDNLNQYKMSRYPQRRILLLIDYDSDLSRLDYIRNKIPEDLRDRVFVLGVFSEPENLRTNMKKSFEEIGKALSSDCAEDTRRVWEHDLLKHNKSELDRMIPIVKPFLFNQSITGW